MSWTEPMYALPIVLDGTDTITVTFSAGLSTTATATIPAGTYYNHRINDADSLLNVVETALDAAEVAASNSSTWVRSEPSTGLTFRSKLVRTGQTGDVIAAFTISSEALRTALGFSELAVTNVTELSNSAPTGTLEGSYQRGHMWVPREILGSDERLPIAEVAGKITAVGRAVVDGYGEYERIRHTIEFVPGVLVYSDKANDADHAGVQVEGMAIGDDCAPLDQFWTLCRTGADGNPPVIKYIPDSTATATLVEDIVIADVAWLADMENVAEKTNDAPLQYRVVINAIESAGTSFTSTGPTIGTAGLDEYDTYNDLPTTANTLGAPADGTTAKVTTTAAAGYYTYVSTSDGYSVDMWLPADYVLQGISYALDGSGYPHRLSPRMGGESLATVEARGWTKSLTNSGTVTDGSDHLLFDTVSTGSNNVAYLLHTTTTTAKKMLLVWEIDCVEGGPVTKSVFYMLGDGTRRRTVSFRANGANEIGWINLGSGASVGDGILSVTTAGERVFVTVPYDGTSTTDSGLCEMWDANVGRDIDKGAGAVMEQFATSTASYGYFVVSTQSGGSAASAKVFELHAFEIG